MGTRRRTAAAQSGLLLAVVEDDLATVQRELEQPNPQWVAAESGVTALHLAAGFASPAVLEALLAAPAPPPSLLDAQLQGDYTDPSVLHPLLDSAVDDTRMAFSGGATALHIAVFFGDAGEPSPCTFSRPAPPCAPPCNATRRSRFLRHVPLPVLTR